MSNKQIYKFPLKEKVPFKAALYLFGHGPYREPRIIEMQYLRILRYCEALEEKLRIKIDIKEIYVDINFPRTEDLEKLINLQALLNDIKKQKIDTVIIDICEGDSFYQNKYTPIIWAMRRVGAKVFNCYYDNEDALLAKLIKYYGVNVHSYMLPDDGDEFVELFPALAAEVTYKVLEDRLSRASANNDDPFINYVFQKVDTLKNKNPYSRSRLPWLSGKKLSELYQLKEEELEKRKLTEETYVLGPGQTGKLLDEDVSRIRNSEDFVWVLNRLRDLGFHHHFEEKKHTFIMEYDGHLVYADPREEGAIEIFVYKKEIEKVTAKKKRGRNNLKDSIGSFKMQDGWKNDLRTKLISRVKGVIRITVK